MPNVVLLAMFSIIDYCVVFNTKRKEYIACWHPTYDDKGKVVCWAQGHYFLDRNDCMDFVKEKVNKHISNMDKEFVVDIIEVNAHL